MTFSSAFRSTLPCAKGSLLASPTKLQRSFVMQPSSPRQTARPLSGVTKAQLSQDELKKQAAWKAVEYVQSGTAIGLGTGSTAAFAVARIGQLLKDGKLKDIIAVPTSIRTYEQAQSERPYVCFTWLGLRPCREAMPQCNYTTPRTGDSELLIHIR